MTYICIDGKWFSDFLKKYENRRIPREDLKTPHVFAALGIKKKTKSEERFFEAFLLRSFLYRVSRNDNRYLEPFLIEGNWSDYARAWRIGKYHLPFRGKIAFIVSEGKTKKLVCHPETSSNVDKILFDPGYLTLRLPGVNVRPNYKANVCQKLIEHCSSSYALQIGDLEIIKKQTDVDPKRFLVILESLGLVKKKNEEYVIGGPKLFCDEIRKTFGFNDLEKAARVILRRDHEKMLYVTTVLLWLESRERFIEPWVEPIGVGKEEDYFSLAVLETSLNSPAISNVFREFSQFNAFFEYYPRELIGEAGYSCYATLSCHVDSLGLIGEYLKGTIDPEHFFKTALKKEKFKRHVEYLLRFVTAKDLLSAIERKDLSFLQQKLVNSEIISLNLNIEEQPDLSALEREFCLSNIFVLSKLPVKDAYFKEKVLETLKSPHSWKAPQEYFYYPDFRFIMSAILGLNFNAFDRILAYQIQNDIDFYSKLFLPILWGIKKKTLKIDESLLSVVPEPFDSIALR